MSLKEIRRDENGNLQRIYEPRYGQQFQRSGYGSDNPYKVDHRTPREGNTSSTRGRSQMSWPASRGRGTGPRVRLTPKKSANERLLKKPRNPERMKKNDPEEMQDLTNTMGNVKLSQRQFEPLYPGDNCICMRPLKYVICRMCGFVVKESRVRKLCEYHPTHLYLLDQSHCSNPRCKAPAETNYLKEIPLPAGFITSKVNKRITQ